MTTPNDVARFHAEYDKHPDDRVRLFEAVTEVVPSSARVLYPGSYVDIGPSIWFDDVTYLDVDKRAARFFSNDDAVRDLVDAKRAAVGRPRRASTIAFHHLDYTAPIPEPRQSYDLLVSLYAGFVSEHCTEHLAVGGALLVNPSHGDAAMASIDPRYRLSGVVISAADGYRLDVTGLDNHLVPKQPQTLTVEALHVSGRGIAYTRSAFAYVFTRVA